MAEIRQKRVPAEPDIEYVVECRVCGRWVTVARQRSRVLAHYSTPSETPGRPSALCVGSGQPGIFLFAQMKSAIPSTAAQKLAKRWR